MYDLIAFAVGAVMILGVIMFLGILAAIFRKRD